MAHRAAKGTGHQPARGPGAQGAALLIEFPLEEAPKAYALIDEHNDDVVQCLLSYRQVTSREK